MADNVAAVGDELLALRGLAKPASRPLVVAGVSVRTGASASSAEPRNWSWRMKPTSWWSMSTSRTGFDIDEAPSGPIPRRDSGVGRDLHRDRRRCPSGCPGRYRPWPRGRSCRGRPSSHPPRRTRPWFGRLTPSPAPSPRHNDRRGRARGWTRTAGAEYPAGLRFHVGALRPEGCICSDQGQPQAAPMAQMPLDRPTFGLRSTTVLVADASNVHPGDARPGRTTTCMSCVCAPCTRHCPGE
jgi:hypothetical protein